MLILRQKEYFWGTVASVGASLLTGAQANKNQKEQAEEMARQQKKMDQANLKIQKQNLEINKQLAKTANQSPESAAIALQQQKSYALTAETKQAIIGAALPTAATLVTGAISNKTAKEDLKERAKTNTAEIKIKQKEADTNKKLAESAVGDPMAAAEALRGRRYSAVKEGAKFAKNLVNTAEKSGIGKRIVGTAAAGAIGVGASYLVDKAIQKDAKNSGMRVAKEDTEEEKEVRKKNRRKRALKLGTTAAIIGGGTIAAKKGLLGKDMKEVASKINKENLGKVARKTGKYAKEGVKEIFTTKENGKTKPNYLGTAAFLAPLALPVYGYATSKKHLKEQIKQSEEEKEKDYSDKKSNPGEKIYLYFLKKKSKKTPQEKTYSLVVKKKKVKIVKKEPLGNKIFKTYLVLKSRGYSKTEDWFKNTAVGKWTIKRKNDVVDFAKGTKDSIVTTAKSFRKRPGTTVLDITSKWKGGGGLKRVNSFGRRLEEAGIKNNNQLSQKVGKAIKDNPKTALAGSIVAGIGITRLGQLGYKKTKKFLKDHDKNAFAYEESQGMIVPKDKKENEDDN